MKGPVGAGNRRRRCRVRGRRDLVGEEDGLEERARGIW